MSFKPMRNISQMQSALDDIAQAIEDLENEIDITLVDDYILRLEDLVQAAQNAHEEAQDDEDEDEDEAQDDEDEDEDSDSD